MGRLEVRVCDARDLHKAIDTYVKLAVGSQTQKTQVVKHCVAPKFDEVFRFQVADTDSTQLRLELWESGTISDARYGSYALSLSGLVKQQVWDQYCLLKDQSHRDGRAELRVRVCAVDFGRADPLALSGSAGPQAAPAGGTPTSWGPGPAAPPGPPVMTPGPHQYPQPQPYYPPQQQHHHPYGYPQPQQQPYPPPPINQMMMQPYMMPPPVGGGGFGLVAPPPNWDSHRVGVLQPPRVAQNAPPWEQLGMTQIEYDHMIAVFVRFDVDDTKSLSKKEMRELLRWLNYATTEEAVDRVFRDMDKSGAHNVTQQEFCSWLAYNRPDPQALYGLPQMEYNHVLAQFRNCDSSKSGQLSYEEFCRFAQANRWVSSRAEAETLFRRVDTGRSGTITLHEFLTWRANDATGRSLSVNMLSTASGGSFSVDSSGSWRSPAAATTPHQLATSPAAATSHGGPATTTTAAADPDMEKFAKIEQLMAFMPQLTAPQASSLLRKYDWDMQRALTAALDGERG